MRSLGWLLLLLVSASGWGWSGAVPLDAHRAPMRTVALPEEADPATWARARGIQHWQLPAGEEGRLLNFRADEGAWQRIQADCGPPGSGLPRCGPDSCQGVRALKSGEPEPWLIPRPPDLAAVLAGRPDSCPNDLSARPWQGNWPSRGGARCWQLAQLNPCQSESTPGEYLEPEWRMNQVVMLLEADAPPSGPWAQALGLRLIDEVTLKSTGQRLLRLLRPAGSATSLDAWVSLLGKRSGALAVQKDFAYFTLAEQALSTPQPDPLARFNYGPALTGADRLARGFGGEGVEVAVIDTGIDSNHPELATRLVAQTDFSGQGYSADAHGTAVAAIIAAARDNGIGASGIAPRARIRSLKACHPLDGGLAARCWSSSLVRALDEAISQGSAVINMSLGGPPSPLLQRLVEEAVRRGRVLVAAAGNGGPNARPVYPAAWPEALAVTAVDAQRRLYRQANRGPYIQLAAPGVDIISAGPGGGQPLVSGTSMAAAHVSGLVALLRQLNPGMAGPQLVDYLVLHGQDLGPPGADTQFGRGLADACATGRELGDVSPFCGGGL